MKVLLLGEYSGFYKNLIVGLKDYDVDVHWFCNGDGFKKITGSDGKLFQVSGHMLPQYYRNFKTRKKYVDYDVVMMIDLRAWGLVLSQPMIEYITKYNKKIFSSMAGDSTFYYDAWKKGKLKYSPFEDNPELSALFDGKTLKSKLLRRMETNNAKKMDGLIPVMNEYRIGISDFNNLEDIIPLPVDTNTIHYSPNVIKEKIVIFHGLNREKSKGTEYIKEALEVIKRRYTDEVEVIIDGKMPLDKYLQVINRANIIVDQCKCSSWGMNACYSMAQGKVVMAGESNETLSGFGIDRSPIFKIIPNVEQIVQQLEFLIHNKNMIEQYGYESRKFVEKLHDCHLVAEQYMKCWQQ